MNDSTTLQILIQLKDEASAAIQTFASNAKASLGEFGATAAESGAIMTAVGGAILAPLYESVKAAAHAQDAMTQFNTIVGNVRGSSQTVKDQLLAAASAFEDLGFQSEDTEVALARFYQRTGDVAGAIEMTKDAMDLARFKNEDLATAITQVNMVMSGQGRILTQVGINLKQAGGGMAALKELEGIIGGSASNAAQNFNEKMLAMRAHLDNLMVEIGNALIPILTQLLNAITPIIESVIKFASEHQTLTKVIVIAAAALGVLLVVLGTLGVLIGGVIALFSSWAGVIAVGVMAAIGALVAITAVVIAKWTDIKNFFKTLWDDITSIFMTAVNAIIGFFDNLIKKVQQVASAISNSVAGKAIGAAASAFSPIGIGSVVSAASSLAGILHLAEGGIVTQPTFALIGEAGPEAVVPLSGNRAGMGEAGSININIGNLYGTDQLAARNFANQIAKMVNQQLKLRTH